MFVGLNKQLVEGETIKATLQFEKAGKVPVEFTVEGIGAHERRRRPRRSMPGMSNDHGGMQMK